MPYATPDFERLCEEEFRLAADSAYENLDREIAGIREQLASMGHILSTAVGEAVKDAVLQRFDRVVQAFDHVYLDKWRDDSKRPLTNEDKRWLDEQVTTQLEPRTAEVGFKCQGLGPPAQRVNTQLNQHSASVRALSAALMRYTETTSPPNDLGFSRSFG